MIVRLRRLCSSITRKTVWGRLRAIATSGIYNRSSRYIRYTVAMGDRASTTRVRLTGKICCCCLFPLPPPHVKRETFCARCATDKQPRRRIYMSFPLSKQWHCQFLEEDVQTPLPLMLHIKDPNKIFDLAERGGYNLNFEGRQAIQHAIEKGRGGIWLELTPEQYQSTRS